MRVYTFEEWVKRHPDLLEPPDKCDECDGTGEMECEECDGEGKCYHCGADCEECDGSGKVDCDFCSEEGLKQTALEQYNQQRLRDEAAWKWLQRVTSTHTETQ